MHVLYWTTANKQASLPMGECATRGEAEAAIHAAAEEIRRQGGNPDLGVFEINEED